ncbi:MAG TPA: hypothetical protein VGT61_03880 [Thermomicrobiales bacterium]|jgi:hypothetical protein|nr:hypothetical protein [Thermomicrobiales bacterium]
MRLRVVRTGLVLVLMMVAFASLTARDLRAGSEDPSTPAVSEVCATGRLHIGQIPDLDAPWSITVEADRSLAVEWRPDAVLVATDLGCGFLTDQPRIRTTFYSADARGLWDPETAQLRPLDPGAPAPKELPAGVVDWPTVYAAIIGLGFSDDDQVGASGITVRLKTNEAHFGPDTIPAETVVVHLTVGDGAATSDVYVDAETGETFSFNPDDRPNDEPAG